MLIRFTTLAFIFVMTTGFISGFSSNAPKVWKKWGKHNPQNSTPIDHSKWDTILKKYITTDETNLNLFSYGDVTTEDNTLLKSYLDDLAAVNITDRSRPVQFAYWVNMYNALTITVILDNYPVDSIRDIDTSGLFANGPWGAKLITVEGETLTLDDIEHRILRPIWQDPRIHYAVNCASVGCPNLNKNAFTAANYEQLIERGARSYINNERGFFIEDGELIVSSIYKWFAYDFGNSEDGILNHLKQYSDAERRQQLEGIKEIADTDYDWFLNE